MKRSILAAATLNVGLLVAVAVAFNANAGLGVAAGIGCSHNGNHYTELIPTVETAGTREYWACCKCHEHYLVEPSIGTWSEAGTAHSVTVDDDRYMSALDTEESMTEYLQEEGFKTVFQNSDGTYLVKGFAYNGEDLIIIPEGVVAFQGKFTNKVKYVVIPKGCSLASNAFNNCTTTKAFFVGTTAREWPISYYQVQGTGWDYVNGIPTAK